MMKTNETRMLAITGVANMLNLHPNTVRRWSDQGIFKTYRMGNRRDRRFMLSDILRFRKNHKSSNPVVQLPEV
jgi:hypothetical protein